MIGTLRLNSPDHEAAIIPAWFGRVRWQCQCGAGTRERQPSDAVKAYIRHLLGHDPAQLLIGEPVRS